MSPPASPPGWLSTANRSSPWAELHACVTGLGVSGFAAADGLLALGARVVVVDARPADQLGGRAQVLQSLGARVLLGPDAARELPRAAQLVVTSPGWRPDAPLLVTAGERGVPVWGEVELAWRLRPAGQRWLVVTGTNGKTTTVRMLAAMLNAAGTRTVAAGNVGTALVDVVTAADPYQVLAVELSSFQLHWSGTISPLAAAVLNIAPDHIDWHGSVPAYEADKGRAYEHCQLACVYNVQDPATERLVRAANVHEGCRAIGFTLGVPSVGMVGLVDGLLVDRAFITARQDSAAELAAVSDVVPAAPHNVANALAAAALARASGVPPAAVRAGLRGFRPDPHRIAVVGRADQVTYVDDSKATNPHAAAASLAAFDRVVWIAGGLAKGAQFDDLVRTAGPRLVGVVLLGRDRALIAAALARHAPNVPVVEVSSTDTGVMDEVVAAAARLARAGDTVLLAPGCASMDLFVDYAARGDAFAAAVNSLPGASAATGGEGGR